MVRARGKLNFSRAFQVVCPIEGPAAPATTAAPAAAVDLLQPHPIVRIELERVADKRVRPRIDRRVAHSVAQTAFAP